MTVSSYLRAQRSRCRICCRAFHLVDSGGSLLPRQDEVFPDRESIFGRISLQPGDDERHGHSAGGGGSRSCTAVALMCRR